MGSSLNISRAHEAILGAKAHRSLRGDASHSRSSERDNTDELCRWCYPSECTDEAIGHISAFGLREVGEEFEGELHQCGVG